MSENEINELINNINDGDLSKRATLYNEYNDYLYRLVVSKSKIKNYALDDVNDIWVKIFNNLSNFDGTKSKFRTWITFLTKNFIIDKFRVKQNTIHFEDIDDMEIGHYSIENLYDYDDILNNISINFSDKEIEVMKMRYSGYSYSDMCDAMNLKSVEIKRVLKTIKNKLESVEY